MKLRTAAILVVLASAGCSKTEAPAPPAAGHVAGPVEKDPAAAKKLIAEGAVVIDVRSPSEFASGHLDRATNLPVQDLDAAAVDKLVGGDRTKPVVVYCAAGGRAAKAKAKLDAAGYTHVVNGGGYDELR